jgi:glucose/arabinose dehydrogenase
MSGKVFGTILACVLAACGGAGGGTSAPAKAPSQVPAPAPNPSSKPLSCASNASPMPTGTVDGPSPKPATGLTVPAGFTISIIANVPAAREVALAPNGDLFVGTGGSSVYLIRDVEGRPGYAHIFATLNDSPAAGVAFSTQNCSLYVGTQFGVYRIGYATGDQVARSDAVRIATVRPSGGGGHVTTSVATTGNTLYASIGSSCDACTESDLTRASIQQMGLDGNGMTARAVHIRNAIALAVNPSTGTLWAGDAGQDELPAGHPYELFDGVTTHAGVADYGWPACEENQHAYRGGASCGNTVVPAVEFPAYSTAIGAAFYPANASGPYAFPAQYRGGAFVALHGSWHSVQGCNVAPLVAFVAMNGDTPRTPVNWSDPHAQWQPFVTGFQPGCSANTRIGRPAGIAIGPQGDLFISDDASGAIYRVRPQ